MSKTLPSFPLHARVDEPELMFHPDRSEDRSSHPLVGLTRFGPYSRSTINAVLDPIRLAVISPSGSLPELDRLFSEFSQTHRPRERVNYLPEYLGFARVFGVNLVRTDVIQEIPSEIDGQLNGSAVPHLLLADAIDRALSVVQARRNEYDIAAIYLPSRWERGFFGPEGDDFDLHDHVKAVAAARGIPTQIINEDRALTYYCRCSVMWRLSIAMYAKAGGIPWKLAETSEDSAYIGLSYAVRRGSGSSQFVTCCSQVFDSDGAGLEFIAYDTDDIHIERENPYLTRSDMRRVMSRSLALYQRRHAGRSPKTVTVHKSTAFTPAEVDGCFDAFSSSTLQLLQVQQDTGWRGVLIERPKQPGASKGVASAYPCYRGTFMPLDGRTVLLWTQGNAPKAALRVGNFYKEGKSIPEPLQITRFAGYGAWEEPCRTILSLTKMNWNNDSLYDRLPVTMAYAHVLAKVLKRMPRLPSTAYEFRFFM